LAAHLGGGRRAQPVHDVHDLALASARFKNRSSRHGYVPGIALLRYAKFLAYHQFCGQDWQARLVASDAPLSHMPHAPEGASHDQGWRVAVGQSGFVCQISDTGRHEFLRLALCCASIVIQLHVAEPAGRELRRLLSLLA
jgi:hypothetical protein